MNKMSRLTSFGQVGDDAVAAYFADIRYLPVLSSEKEKELTIKAHSGDLSARNALVESQLKLVVHFVKKYRNSAELLDLIQIANLALVEAINSFNPTRGRLSTFCSVCLHSAMMSYFHRRQSDLQEVPLFDNIDEVEAVKELLPEVSCSSANERAICKLLTCLPSKEHEILDYAFGLEGKKKCSFNEIGLRYHLSGERTRQLKKNALKKLRVLLLKKPEAVFC